MLKIVAVEYINTLPFLQGLKKTECQKRFQIDTAYPSRCARLFASGKADIALVPVAALAEMPPHRIVGNYAIGCAGEVKTVALLSNNPVEELDHILLDHHSRTSSDLCRIFAKHLWKKEYSFSVANKVSYLDIEDDTGIVLIGDKVRDAESAFTYKYDFGSIWYDWQKLPFVFAVWICKAALSRESEQYFCSSLEQSFESFDPDEINGLKDPGFWKTYLQDNIHFEFGNPEKKALNKFFELLKELKCISI